MTTKTYLIWTHTRNWCEQNPEKIAAIITPKGYFEITFKPRDILSEKGFVTKEYDWLEKFFIE